MQTTSHILMIRPVNFGFNPETAVNNAFQKKEEKENIQVLALQEFNDFVNVLRVNGIDVTVITDTPNPYTPDSIFPNNWISFHSDGCVFIYPMFAPNRRMEKKENVLKAIDEKFIVTQKRDLSLYESQQLFLEGTGSMVLDRDNKIAYACISPRTSIEVLNDFCKQQGYQPAIYTATDANGKEIYHTNVIMCVAEAYVVICLDSITSENQKQVITDIITRTNKEIIPISMGQMEQFAGNMLQVQNEESEKLLVMSSQAFHSLTAEQIKKLESYNRIIHSPLLTIETNGGGSARCMMAEIFLPVRAQI